MDPIAIGGLIVGGAGVGFAAWQVYLAKRQLRLQVEQQSGKGELQIPQLASASTQEPIESLHISSFKEPAVQPHWKGLLKIILLSEIHEQLSKGDIFGVKGLSDSINHIRENPSFIERVHSVHALDNILLTRLPSSQQVGILDEKLKKYLRNGKRPINVAFPTSLLATTAIFFYLKIKKNYNLHLLYKFPHALELAERIEKKNIDTMPHVCVLSEAPAIRLINQPHLRYVATIPMPQGEQRIIAPAADQEYRADAFREGNFVLLTDELSTHVFHQEQLKRRGKIKASRVQEENREPHEAVPILQSGDIDKRLILWSPHWQLFSALGIGVTLGKKSESGYSFNSILFFRESMSSHFKEAMTIAIRDAWIALLDKECLIEIVETMLADEEYIEAMGRFCGIYQLQQAAPNNSFNPTP